MILVDTSVLINYLKGVSTVAAGKFQDAIDKKIPFGISPYTYQEILQGAANEQEFTLLREYLDTQVFYDLMHGRASFSEAAMIYFRCRRMGITIRSTIDVLIVQTALENELFLLHDDKDFTAIKKAVPGLKVYQLS
jgi:predicted nucleic acid-binding protein